MLPCPIVPAKKMPGHGRALPPRGLGGQPARAECRDAQVGQVLQRTDEPGGRDDLVDLDLEVAAPVGATQEQVEAAVAAGRRLDALERGIEDRHATAQDVVLVGLDVARPDPDQRARVDRQLGVRRREQHELARPREQAVRELEPRVLLADDADPPARIRLGRPHVGVVVAERLARAGRRVRLGDPDRHDEDLGPIGAVRRLDHVGSAGRRLLDASSRSIGTRSGRRRRRARRRSRGSPPSPVATGSTTSDPSTRAGSPGSPRSRRAGCSSRTARRRGSPAGPARAAWSTTAGAGRTASAGTCRRATGRTR